jgi:DNA-binding MarR family transcriptional regulator
MPPAVRFSPQLLGRTEKALNAILARLLREPGLTEHQWITLSLAVAGDGSVDRDRLADRVASALKGTHEEAQARIAELDAAGLLRSANPGPAPVTVTEEGRRLHARIRDAVSSITQRLWGDLPERDLETAGRVLTTVLTRADEEVATT